MPGSHQSKFVKRAWTIALLPLGFGFCVIFTLAWKLESRAAAQTAAVEKIPAAPPDAHVAAKTPEEAGRYLIMTTGCNDCHTAGYAIAQGQVPELNWLTGSPIGWYGPWGTTYASNLRLMVADMPEDVWVKLLHERHELPPMPWTSVNSMSEQDTRAMYKYIKSLGRQGQQMPGPLAAGKEPKTLYLSMIPQSPAEK